MLLRQLLSIALTSALLILSGCGGGGNDGSINNDDLPTATSGVLFTFIDVPSNGILNPSDPKNGALTYTIVTNGSMGTAVITNPATGEYTYTPNPGAEGTDTFTFRVSDGTSDSNIAVVTVHIKFNNPPVANDDNYTVNEGDTIIKDALTGTLANDTDAENQALTATLIENVSNGMLTFYSDGSFGYTHDGGETTSDSFNYRVNDGFKDSQIATVNINVNAVNDPPVANSESYTVNEGGQLNITTSQGVLINDTDVDGPGLVAILDSNVVNGTLTLNGDGSFLYIHNGSETTGDSFKYKANDGFRNSNVVVVTIHINPVNDAPVAADDTNATGEESILNVTANNGVLANDSDAEQQPLTITAFDSTSNIGAAVNVNSDGSYSYDARSVAAVQALSAGEQFIDQFTYTISDGNGGTSIGTVRITITGQNDVPVANADTRTTNDNTILNVPAAGVLVNDTDIDINDVLSVTNYDSTSTKGAIVVINTNGSYTYDPTGSAIIQALNLGDQLSDTFTYTISDSHGGVSTATVTITVNGSNSSPVANDDNGQTINEDSVLNVSASGGVLNNDTDAEDDAQGIALTIIAGATSSANGAAVTITAQGGYTYDPTIANTIQALRPGEQIHDTFTYTVRDSAGATATGTVSVFVNGVNDMPVATASCGTTPETQDYTSTLGGTDIETPSSIMFSLGLNGSGGEGPITTGKGGKVTLLDSTTGEYTYDPQFITSRGLDTFTYSVSDPDGGITNAMETVILDQKIMPLGDSITRGAFGGGTPADSHKVGYRKPLYDGLVTAGYSFDFVGSDSLTGNDPSLQPFDPDNEGHGGWTDDEIAWGRTGYPVDGIRAWLDMSPSDYILLHIGTNSLNTSASDIEDILDQIDVWESDNSQTLTVILARIIDNNPSDPDITTFNNNVEAMALDRINNPANDAYPDKIIIVDQQAALWDINDQPDPALYGDFTHPNTAGYANMAAAWFDELAHLLDKCP